MLTAWLLGWLRRRRCLFLISGYLISGLLIEECKKDGAISFGRFYARRARRLLAAAFLTFAATLIAASFILSPLEYKELGKDGIAAALSFSNIWFASNAADYFATEITNSTLLHTWSLAVEEQFYLIWPALIAGLMHVIRSTAAKVWILGAITAIGLIACTLITEFQQVWASYGTPFRVWEIGLGTIVSLVMPPKEQHSGRILVYLGLGAVITSSFLLNSSTPFPGIYAAAPVVESVRLAV